MRNLRPPILTLLSIAILALAGVGCDDSPRQVKESEEYSFDDMAAMAAEESKLSEVEQ